MLVGHQIHHLYREQEKYHRQHRRQSAAQHAGHADGAADAFQIPLAPVLADEDTKTALDAKNDADKEKDRDICAGNGGHFVVSQLADH